MSRRAPRRRPLLQGVLESLHCQAVLYRPGHLGNVAEADHGETVNTAGDLEPLTPRTGALPQQPCGPCTGLEAGRADLQVCRGDGVRKLAVTWLQVHPLGREERLLAVQCPRFQGLWGQREKDSVSSKNCLTREKFPAVSESHQFFLDQLSDPELDMTSRKEGVLVLDCVLYPVLGAVQNLMSPTESVQPVSIVRFHLSVQNML